MLKERIRPFVRPLPQWSALAIDPPQQVVSAMLHGDAGSTDVTAGHTVASLKPLTIATGMDCGERATIEYSDTADGRLLGSLDLARCGSVPNMPVTFYRVTVGTHRCLSWPLRPWNAWLQNRAIRRNRAPHNFYMEPASVQQLMIAYLCPRPVVLVSVVGPGQANIFPMDLIGPLMDRFSLALRSTNISVPVMRSVGRVALSAVPATMKSVAYKLGEHHKEPLDDWDGLPFRVRPSGTFGIPAVDAALKVEELVIEHTQEIGSHTFFLGRIASAEAVAQGAQLHHTAGFHQAARRLLGVAFPDA